MTVRLRERVLSRTAMYRARLLTRSLLLAGLVLVFLAMRIAVETYHASLREVYFPSGWAAFGLLSWLAIDSWTAHAEPSTLRRLLRRHVWFGSVLVLVLCVHVAFRLPNGWLDLALTLLALGFLGSTAVGLWLLHAYGKREGGQRGLDSQTSLEWIGVWFTLHTCLGFVVVSLATFHALITHCHGLLAHYLLGK